MYPVMSVGTSAAIVIVPSPRSTNHRHSEAEPELRRQHPRNQRQRRDVPGAERSPQRKPDPEPLQHLADVETARQRADRRHSGGKQLPAEHDVAHRDHEPASERRADRRHAGEPPRNGGGDQRRRQLQRREPQHQLPTLTPVVLRGERHPIWRLSPEAVESRAQKNHFWPSIGRSEVALWPSGASKPPQKRAHYRGLFAVLQQRAEVLFTDISAGTYLLFRPRP